MSLHRLVYVSRPTRALTGEAFAALGEGAQRRNRAAGITGLLVRLDGHYAQVLEGEPAAVQALYDRISADERHCFLKLLSFGPCDRRMFNDWSMGVVDFTLANEVDWIRNLLPRFDFAQFEAMAGDRMHDAEAALAEVRRARAAA